MFYFYNLSFQGIQDLDEKPVQESDYMPFLKNVRTDSPLIDFTATHTDIEIVDVNADLVIKTVGSVPQPSELINFEKYELLPTGKTVLRNTVRVLNYNNLKFNKGNKYILNMYPIVGEFVTDITSVLEDGTEVLDVYFETLARLSSTFNVNTCLYIFQFKDISSPNTLILNCDLQSGGTTQIRFNINE